MNSGTILTIIYVFASGGTIGSIITYLFNRQNKKAEQKKNEAQTEHLRIADVEKLEKMFKDLTEKNIDGLKCRIDILEKSGLEDLKKYNDLFKKYSTLEVLYQQLLNVNNDIKNKIANMLLVVCYKNTCENRINVME